jgi:hypothetical protein
VTRSTQTQTEISKGNIKSAPLFVLRFTPKGIWSPWRSPQEMRVPLLAALMCGIPLAAAFTVPAGNLCAGLAAAPRINALQSSSRVGGAVSREGGALSLRAEGGNGERPEPKDGSIEKLLGGLGPMGAKMGAGIDWCVPSMRPRGGGAALPVASRRRAPGHEHAGFALGRFFDTSDIQGAKVLSNFSRLRRTKGRAN